MAPRTAKTSSQRPQTAAKKAEASSSRLPSPPQAGIKTRRGYREKPEPLQRSVTTERRSRLPVKGKARQTTPEDSEPPSPPPNKQRASSRDFDWDHDPEDEEEAARAALRESERPRTPGSMHAGGRQEDDPSAFDKLAKIEEDLDEFDWSPIREAFLQQVRDLEGLNGLDEEGPVEDGEAEAERGSSLAGGSLSVAQLALMNRVRMGLLDLVGVLAKDLAKEWGKNELTIRSYIRPDTHSWNSPHAFNDFAATLTEEEKPKVDKSNKGDVARKIRDLYAERTNDMSQVEKKRFDRLNYLRHAKNKASTSQVQAFERACQQLASQQKSLESDHLSVVSLVVAHNGEPSAVGTSRVIVANQGLKKVMSENLGWVQGSLEFFEEFMKHYVDLKLEPSLIMRQLATQPDRAICLPQPSLDSFREVIPEGPSSSSKAGRGESIFKNRDIARKAITEHLRIILNAALGEDFKRVPWKAALHALASQGKVLVGWYSSYTCLPPNFSYPFTRPTGKQEGFTNELVKFCWEEHQEGKPAVRGLRQAERAMLESADKGAGFDNPVVVTNTGIPLILVRHLGNPGNLVKKARVALNIQVHKSPIASSSKRPRPEWEEPEDVPAAKRVRETPPHLNEDWLVGDL